MGKRSDGYDGCGILRVCLALLLAVALYPAMAAAHGVGHSHDTAATSHDSAHHKSDPTLADVHAEVTELRRQLAGYEQTIRVRDVLGGLGYLAGIAGAAFYFLGKPRGEVAE